MLRFVSFIKWMTQQLGDTRCLACCVCDELSELPCDIKLGVPLTAKVLFFLSKVVPSPCGLRVSVQYRIMCSTYRESRLVSSQVVPSPSGQRVTVLFKIMCSTYRESRLVSSQVVPSACGERLTVLYEICVPLQGN